MNEKIFGFGEGAEIAFAIPGEPSRVTHQSGTRIGKNGRVYKKKPLLEWEQRLMDEMKLHTPPEPLEGPLLLKVSFGFKARRHKDWFTYKTTRPDTDNLIKTVKDCMIRSGFWIDDSQVVIEFGQKLWVPDPGIVIAIEKLGGRCEDWRIQE